MTQIETLGEEIGALQIRYGFTTKYLSGVLSIPPSQLSRKINGKQCFTSGEIRTVRRWINNLKPIRNKYK